MAGHRIDVRLEATAAGWTAQVTVGSDGGTSTHEVTLTREACERLTGGRATAEELVRASFEFLLEREPAESILRAFDLTVISRYFPQYEREMRRRLGR